MQKLLAWREEEKMNSRTHKEKKKLASADNIGVYFIRLEQQTELTNTREQRERERQKQDAICWKLKQREA